MKNTSVTNRIYRRASTIVDRPLIKLLELKKKRERLKFNNMLEKIIPDLSHYFNQRLLLATVQEKIPEGNYDVQDLVNEIYVRAYKHLESVKEEKHLYSWVFRQAEELLDEIIVESDFDQAFFQNIEDYTQQMWDEMEEEFTSDADGDLVMVEELTDMSYPKYNYSLTDVFVEDKQDELMQRINNAMDEEALQRKLRLVFSKIPKRMQNYFDLATIQEFNPEEIAYITQSNIRDVTVFLKSFKQGLTNSISKRYLNS